MPQQQRQQQQVPIESSERDQSQSKSFPIFNNHQSGAGHERKLVDASDAKTTTNTMQARRTGEANPENGAAVAAAVADGDRTTQAPETREQQHPIQDTTSATTTEKVAAAAGHPTPKPAAKLNGLKNRIIQRPPPLILDKVSNFYRNDQQQQQGEANSHQQSTGDENVTTSGQRNNETDHAQQARQISANTQQAKAGATTVAAPSQPNSIKQDICPQQQQQPINNTNNSQSSINNTNSANQKFWASLNENATRNKALAVARNSVNATVATIASETISAKDLNARPAADTTTDSSLGADLIISHRNSISADLTNRLVSNSTVKRHPQLHQSQQQSHQQHQHQPQTLQHQPHQLHYQLPYSRSEQSHLELGKGAHDAAHSENNHNQHNEELQQVAPSRQQHHHHRQRRLSIVGTEQTEHDAVQAHLNASNNSTEPDDGAIAPHQDNDHGGNLIGVDNPTPPPVPDAHLSNEDVPISATSQRSRSNNPFLDDNEIDELDSNQERNNFHKRPASFIAATDRAATQQRQSSYNYANHFGQKIVEERLTELALGESYNNSSVEPIYSQEGAANRLFDGTYQQNETFPSGHEQRDHPIELAEGAYNDRALSMELQRKMSDSQYNQLEPNKSAPANHLTGYVNNAFHEPSISLDSESAVCQPPPSATMQLPHWSEAIYEINYATLEPSSVGGGAENGQFIHIIETGDIVLELDHIKVSGFTLAEFTELIEAKQFHLRAVQTKHSRGLTTDLKQYLKYCFPKESQDRQLQTVIRENIYRRTVPCTTRPSRVGEIDKVDYHFLTKDQFNELNNKGLLLECGAYQGHYYGTLKPSCDLNNLSVYRNSNGLGLPHPEIPKLWDSNHPALDVTAFKKENNNPCLGDVPVEHPLYENHESLRKQTLQNPMLAIPVQMNEFESIANQNGIHLQEGSQYAVKKPPSIVAVDSNSLPPGWERVIDQTHGTYYIDHNTQRTQYERPYDVELTKGADGFGFTLIEADSGLLLVRNIIPGGPAYFNGQMKPGDILISVVGVSVAGLHHTDLARLFSTFAIGDQVRLTFARSTYVLDDNLVPDEYLFSNGTDGNLAIAVNSNSYANNYLQQAASAATLTPQEIQVNQDFEFLSVRLKRGDKGFGFTISDSIAGQKVKMIENHEVCSNLKQGDILTVLNGEDITKLTHKEVVEKLKSCPAGQEVTLTVRRKKRFRSKTPMALHTDLSGAQLPDAKLQQRNCKTPSDSLVLRDSVNHNYNYNSEMQHTANDLFTNQLTGNHSQFLATHPMPNRCPISMPPAPTLQQDTSSQIYGILPPRHQQQQQQLQQPQPILVPQPIYGTTQSQPILPQRPQDIYQRSLPPMSTIQQQENQDLSNQQLQQHMHAASLRDDLLQNHPASFYASEQMLLPPSPARFNNQVNQYNNFMNNDKLVMLQMQHQAQQPLYSNGDIMRHGQVHQQQPLVPAKPHISQYMSSLYAAATDFQNNYYANNEEIQLQRSQYDDSARFVGAANAAAVQQQVGLQTPQEEQDEYEYHDVDLDRESTDSNWGIRLIGGAEVDRAISIGSIVSGGAAAKNGKLKSGDEIITINGVKVVGATHQHVVELISACANRASLVVRRKKFAEACEIVLTRNMDEGFGFVIISSGNCALVGTIIEGSPADRCKQLHVRDRIIAVNGRYITPNMQHPEIVNMIKECGSTLRLRIIPVDCYTVELIKNSQNDNFGFRMRGGSEYDGTPLYILRVAPNGLARDLLNVGDQILEINNIPTIGMTHHQAATIIKYSDPIVKLKLRRNYVTPPSLLVDSPRALQKFNQVTAEMKPVNSTPNTLVGGCDTVSQVSSTEATGSGGGGSSGPRPVLRPTSIDQVYHHNQAPDQQQFASVVYGQIEQDPATGMVGYGTTLHQQQHQQHQPQQAQHQFGNQSLPLYAT